MRKNFGWFWALVFFGLAACSDDSGTNNNGDAGNDVDNDAVISPDAGADDGTGEDAGMDADQPDMDVETPVEVCADAIAPPAAGLCDATAGTSGILLHVGQVLAPEAIYENGYVLVDDAGIITCTGCDCASQAGAAAATKISCADAVLSPGLINAHEHITFSTLAPAPASDERYDHRHDWRRGIRGHNRISSPSDTSREALLMVELRNIITGATSMSGSGSTQGLVRNLDRPADQEGLTGVNVDYDTFPLGDNGGELLSTGCNYPSIAPQTSLNAGIYQPHVSEGIDPEARNEYLCLSNAMASGVDLIAANTSIVHGVGLNADDIADIAANGAKLIWSPRSNISLYGMTARIPLFRRFGVTIAMGTDWSLSGSATMLRELKCAASLNATQYGGLLSDRELWEMATVNGAIAMGAENQLGSIKVGYIADLALFARVGRNAYSAVIEADTTQTALVLRAGQPMVGDANIIEALVPAADISKCEALSICQTERRICLERDTGITLAQITAALPQTAYGPFFCGTPPGEPTCIPSRPEEFDGVSSVTDQDGDGIPNDADICPAQFNPVRPLDLNSTQADFDNDATGDECDVCPLAEGATCPMYNPDDRDADGVANLLDNCPAVSNPDQADEDGDDIGDACDTCPGFDNSTALYCPTTIYDIRAGTVATGALVQITDALVIAASGTTIFVRVAPGSPTFTSQDNSGLQIFLGNGAVSTPPNLGDVVTLVGSVSEFGGSPQMDKIQTLQVTSSGVALPDPIDVSVADVVTGGPKASTLQGLLVRVQDVTVTSSNPDAPSDFQEFEVDGLRVDDLLFAVPTRPSVGETFSSITGILHFSFSNTKVCPRSADDLLTGPPSLIAFNPADVFVEAGTTGGVPPLLVRLSGAALGDTTVSLTYTGEVSGPASVIVPNGQSTATVALTGGVVGAGTVTASLDGTMFTANVTVYDATSVRDVAALTPATQDLVINQTGMMTVSLTVPAGAGGATVNLTATGGLVVPATVTVPEGALSASFAVDAPATGGLGTVTASLTAMVSADVNVIEPSADCVIISEVIEGSGSNNKAFEIFNCSGADVDLADFGICLISNAGTTCSAASALSGTLVAGDVATYCKSKAASTTDPLPGIANNCDTTLPTIANFNGDDRLLLFRDINGNGTYQAGTDAVVDAFGQTAVRPASEIWKDATYSRCNFTPYDGTTPFLVTDYYSALPNGDTSNFGSAPSETCN
ncbi:MAG: amidohydrolase family protein [bacterium]